MEQREEIDTLLASDLESIYGKSITPKELGKFLGIDARTVVKYAVMRGGVEVSPGKFRFFEKNIRRRLDAKFDQEARKKALERHCDVSGPKEGETFSGRHKKIKTRGVAMGTRNSRRDEKRRDRHGLLDPV